ncbi:hypothetical protein TI39_contig345g00055 [Zymoseptoria brevis]|uniref:Uncharacterized protein n=1 Tax=Zymoseptoria brevis TaxID=1047168 RepID=A0A0F4GUX5_9PEZI|nr:hypothetical protein TI39_contig345g00055 [Zymoseptoria brevis]
MDWGSTLAPRRAGHDTEEAVYLPTQHNAEGALMFLLGKDYGEDASDESLIGKAAVKTLKYPGASNSVYRAMITIGSHRRSALLRKWVADYSTKPMTKKTAKNLSLFSSPRYNPGKGEKHMQDSVRSDVGWEEKESTKPLSQKTESPYAMRMPMGDSRARTVESTPTPQSRRVKSCASDSFVFLETPLASPNAGGKYGETVSSLSSYGGWGQPRSAITATPAASPVNHRNNDESYRMPNLVAATPVSQQNHSGNKDNWGQRFVDYQSKSQEAGSGLLDSAKRSDGPEKPWNGLPSVTQHFVRGQGWTTSKNGVKVIDDKNNLGWDQCSSPAKSESKQTVDQSKLQNQIDSLQWRLADISDSLQQVLKSQEELKASVDQNKPAATAHNDSQPCSATPSKSLYDLLAMPTAIAPPQTTSQLDNATRESIHRVEVELAKLSVNLRGQAAPITNNNDGEVALREVKRLDDVLTRAIATIDGQASLIENLENRQTSFANMAHMYDDRVVQCEVRIAECEDQMERYPGDWDTGEMNERINSAVDFDEQLLQKLDVVNERLDKLEDPTALNSYGCARVLCECDDCNTVGQAAEGRKIEDHQNGAGPDWQHNTCSRCPTDTHYTRHCHIPPMELCGWGCGWAEHLGQGCRLGQAPYGVPPSCRCEDCVSGPEKDASGSSKTREDDDGWGPPEPCSACGSTSHNANDCWGNGLCGWCGEEEHQGWKCRERINSAW